MPRFGSMTASRRGYGSVLLAMIIISAGVAGWAAMAPISFDSKEELFEIPKGTWARRMAGSKVEILPSEIRLMVSLRDVLVLRNLDDVPQIFGPTLIMPGQSFKLPFELASNYQFACTAHASGQMTVIVDPVPAPGAERLAWRWTALKRKVITMMGWGTT